MRNITGPWLTQCGYIFKFKRWKLQVFRILIALVLVFIIGYSVWSHEIPLWPPENNLAVPKIHLIKYDFFLFYLKHPSPISRLVTGKQAGESRLSGKKNRKWLWWPQASLLDGECLVSMEKLERESVIGELSVGRKFSDLASVFSSLRIFLYSAQ